MKKRGQRGKEKEGENIVRWQTGEGESEEKGNCHHLNEQKRKSLVFLVLVQTTVTVSSPKEMAVVFVETC